MTRLQKFVRENVTSLISLSLHAFSLIIESTKKGIAIYNVIQNLQQKLTLHITAMYF